VAVGALNESQARRLRVTCQYVDRLLGEIEALLNAAGSKAAFPKYIPDVSPADRRTIEDYIAFARSLAACFRGRESRRNRRKFPRGAPCGRT
jgi:hypothetical protein